MQRDYHKILGIEAGATQAEIKRAYRRLARKYHPDLNPAANAEQMFLMVKEAYEALSGADTARRQANRRAYEQWREEVRREARRQAQMRWKEFRRQYMAARRKDVRQTVIMAISIVLGLTLLITGSLMYEDWMIDRHKAVSVAYITAAKPGGLGKNVHIRFEHKGQMLEQGMDESHTYKYVLAGNGMPVLAGHSFPVEFDSLDPSNFRLRYDQPTQKTLRSYLALAASRAEMLFAEQLREASAEEKDRFGECLAQRVYAKYGIDGLAYLFFHDEYVFENFSHNSLTYWFWSLKDGYRALVEGCLSAIR